MNKYLEIKITFEENRNDEKAFHMSKYMKDKFKYYGIATPYRRAICKNLFKQEKNNQKIDWEFLDLCYMDEYREMQYLVVDYLETMQKYITYDDIPKLENYVKVKQWWDTIDGFDKIIGNLVFIDDRINDLMLKWSISDDLWFRRIAIDHQLAMKDKTNTNLLEKIIINNFGSKEFFINKAIGWSLREYSKTNPEWVKKFIHKYKDDMSNLSIKEASKYI